MPVASTNLTGVQSQALTALAAGGQVVNLLSPSGATKAAVGDILAAAGDIVSLINTADATLASFTGLLRDPIAASFSTGQPYAGAFITAPTVSQIVPVDFSSALSVSTTALSLLSDTQQAVLSAQTGVTLVSDADLATAMATVFSNVQSDFKLAFSIDLATVTPTAIAPTIAASTTLTISIPPLTVSPNITALSNFITASTASFPNVIGLAGVAASIWVDGLGVSVSSTGTPVSGVPAEIDSGVYGDIMTAANTIQTPTTPITVVDYSYQQNQYNLVMAMAIDNGVTAGVTNLLTSPLMTAATTQLIKNRLSSVVQRGDLVMLNTLISALGANNVPNGAGLITSVLTNIQPTDQTPTVTPSVITTGGATNGTATSVSTSQTSSVTPPIVTASGITIGTTTNFMTIAEAITQIEAALTALGLTIATICSQNTCGVTFSSQALLNTTLMQQFNQPILKALLDPTTVEMAMMF
ncbi:unnamed protein product [Sphagnum jensenii]|uniref:Uncharacterized protein n=1 Tax=Sphagnum jensenii TaxID=128206 RepID=A0ABP0VIH4_9BRYO